MARHLTGEPLGPLEWTRTYGYLYPRHIFRAALVAAMPPLTAATIEVCFGVWETANSAWRSSVAQRFNQPRDEHGRFAAAR